MPPKKAESKPAAGKPAADAKPAEKQVAEPKPAAAKSVAEPKPAAGKKGADKPDDKSSTTSTTSTTTTAQVGGKAEAVKFSNDPEEAAIQQRMAAIDAEIKEHRNTLDNIRSDFGTKSTAKQSVFDQLMATKKIRDGYITDHKAAQEEFQKLKAKSGDKATALKALEDELKAIREENKFGSSKGKNTAPEIYLAEIDAKIKKAELDQTTKGSTSLADEKRAQAEINNLKKQRLTYKTYYEKDLVYQSDRNALQTFRDQEVTVARKKADEIYEKLVAARDDYAKVDASFKEDKKTLDSFNADRTVARDKIADLQNEYQLKKKELSDYRDKKKDEKREQIQAERDAQRRYRQELDDRRREADEKRFQEELKQEPYSEEAAVIDQLIKYLNPFVPKAPKPAAPADAAGSPASPAAVPAKDAAVAKPAAQSPAPLRDNGPTGIALVKDKEDDSIPLSKRNKKKKEKVEKDKEFKMNLQIVLQFESVSLTPPAKLSDVERSISQLREKKTYYQKKAVDERNARVDQLKKDKASRDKEKAEAAAALAASDPPPSTTDSSETSTTTTTTTTTASSEVEAN